MDTDIYITCYGHRHIYEREREGGTTYCNHPNGDMTTSSLIFGAVGRRSIVIQGCGNAISEFKCNPGSSSEMASKHIHKIKLKQVVRSQERMMQWAFQFFL